jgi:hypothetical protein
VTSQRTLQNIKAMPYIRETLISFFWICEYFQLISFKERYLVFADEQITI